MFLLKRVQDALKGNSEGGITGCLDKKKQLENVRKAQNLVKEGKIWEDLKPQGADTGICSRPTHFPLPERRRATELSAGDRMAPG